MSDEKYEIYSIDKKVIFNGDYTDARFEAQRKANEWEQLIVLKNERGKVIANFTPSLYNPDRY